MITSYETAVAVAKDRQTRNRAALAIVSFTNTSKKQTRYRIYPENLASRYGVRDCKVGERPKIEAYVRDSDVVKVG